MISPVMYGPSSTMGGGSGLNTTPTDSFVPATDELKRFDSLAKLQSKDRKQEELSELYRLHGEWIAGGGRTLFDPAFTKLPDIFIMMARGAELVVAGDRPVLTSALWGTADVRDLNGIKGRYLGNVGQAALARDIAIVTGRLDVNLQKFTNLIVPKETKKGERKAEVRARGWSMIGIDWRRYLYFAGLGIIDGYWDPWVNVTGYDAFSTRYFQGDSLKTYLVATSLLNKDQFARLDWGKQKHTNVKDQAIIRAVLVRGLEDGSYLGEAGYDRFATDTFQGDSQKAWQVASSLISKDQFASLDWGKCKKTNVKDQAAIRAALRGGEYRDHKGQMKFAAKFYAGDLRKAYQVARSLLDDVCYNALGWRASDALSGAYDDEAFDMLGNDDEDFGT